MKFTLTTCPYCGCGCQFYLMTEGGRLVGVAPSSAHPVSGGSLCIQGWNACRFVQDRRRATVPLVRTGGVLRETDWEKALERAASGFRDLQHRHGKDAVAFFSSARITNEENFLLMKLARAVFGTNNVDHGARLGQASPVAGLAAAFGAAAMTNSIADIDAADVILVTGSNTTEEHPLIGARILKAVDRGAILIVVDHRRIPLSRFATVHLRPKSGTDVAWLNAFMNVLLAGDLADRMFIRSYTENVEELSSAVAPYTPERAAEITGIPPEDLRQAALLYGRARASMLFYGAGIAPGARGTDSVKACADLALLTGNLGRPGTGVNPLRGRNNAQGACDMGALPDVYSGYQKIADPAVRKTFASAWGVASLPDTPGLTAAETVEAARDGRLKGLFLVGENPLFSHPDTRFAERAFSRLELLVVQDVFPTKTAGQADVFLPAACFAEKDGTFTNTDRRVQRVRKALEPPGQSLPDGEIFRRLAAASGSRVLGRADPRDVFEEIRALTPSYRGITYDRIENRSLQWPCPHEKHPGTPILHAYGAFTRGRGVFLPAAGEPPGQEIEPPQARLEERRKRRLRMRLEQERW